MLRGWLLIFFLCIAPCFTPVVGMLAWIASVVCSQTRNPIAVNRVSNEETAPRYDVLTHDLSLWRDAETLGKYLRPEGRPSLDIPFLIQDLSRVDPQGRTVLHALVIERIETCREIFEYLRTFPNVKEAHGKKIEKLFFTQDAFGKTPLHYALINHDKYMLQAILDCTPTRCVHSLIDLLDGDERNALSYARDWHPDITLLLMRKQREAPQPHGDDFVVIVSSS